MSEHPRTLHRSGAVARMLRMPVATLRVWERRYALTQPQLSPSGQRLYSADDVRRLALIKQLTDLGHAIGSLAGLDMAQLQRVAHTHAEVLASSQKAQVVGDAVVVQRPQEPPRVWRLAVIGTALGRRLQRPVFLRHLGQTVALLGPFVDLAQAAAALHVNDLDALLVHAPQMDENWRACLEAQAPSLLGVPTAVLFGFAPDAVCEAMASHGMHLLRDPQPDVVVAQWLVSLARAATVTSAAADRVESAPEPIAARRWDDAALADFAGLSTTVACECPRHVAELLMQLSHFEAYSAACERRNDADAVLHAYLKAVAGDARTRFEAALEHVAVHEGLLLPASHRA